MKKLAIMLSLAGMAATSFGQGYVSVAADSSTLVNTNSSVDISGNPVSGGGSGAIAKGTGAYQFALLTAPFTGTSNSTSLNGSGSSLHGWLFTGLQAANSATFAGRFNLGSDVQALNATAGTMNQWMVVGWSTSIASTWAAFAPILGAGLQGQTGYYGVSGLGTAAAGAAPPATPTSIYGLGNPIGGPFDLNTISPVPEPATFALAGLGAAAMLIFRRRSSK
jgi:hypothetical protein